MVRSGLRVPRLQPVAVSEPWPAWAREALHQFKLPASERTAILSMTAAELFTTWAVTEARALRRWPVRARRAGIRRQGSHWLTVTWRSGDPWPGVIRC